MRRRISVLVVGLGCALFAQKLPFDAAAMMKLKRVAEPQISPDGQTVAFTVTSIDVENNARPRQIYTVPVSGGTPKSITTPGRHERPRWSPDSKKIAYISDQGGSSQIWLIDPDGSNAKQVTKLSTEASGVLWTPDGKSLLFTSDVYPECSDDACNAKKLEAEKNSKVKAKVYTGLLYRHWTEWQGARRRHLMVVSVDGGTPKDLTPGLKFDVPPFSLGGPDDYAVSPDSKEVCYAANLDERQAFSTNSDLYTVPIEGGEPKKISTSMGADNSPLYSPDGKYLAWRTQERTGYESDRWRLLVMERATSAMTILTETLDRPVTGFTWHPDSQRLAFTSEDRGRQVAQLVPATGGGLLMLTQGAAHVDDVQFSSDGKTLVYTEMSGSSPTEIYAAKSGDRAPRALTRLNEAVLAQYQLTALESISVKGAEDAPVQAFVVKPPNFDPSKKYPLLVLIHGGPQGAWGESFSYRWNQQVFAAAGYVVVMPNPRGSTGYGQKFTDDVNGDWGGRAYEDIMAVTDYMARQAYVDPERMAAAGGSYGGYMVNWILGHTNRFKALVSHAGVYDLRSMGGETEELWFTTWEFGGLPWEKPEVYEKWSPSSSAREFKTPTLVIHGELDYRVPVGQGMQLFTALQAQKIPSKMLLYPDEGHWILKPQNSLLWYQSFLDWVGEWTAKK